MNGQDRNAPLDSAATKAEPVGPPPAAADVAKPQNAGVDGKTLPGLTRAVAFLGDLSRPMTETEAGQDLWSATANKAAASVAIRAAEAALSEAKQELARTTTTRVKAAEKRSALVWRYYGPNREQVLEALQTARDEEGELTKLCGEATARVQALQEALRAAQIEEAECNVLILKLTTDAQVRRVMSGIPTDERPGVQDFYAQVLAVGWCRAIKAEAGKAYMRDVGGMLLALYSRTCNRRTLRVMAQYMGDDPLVFRAAVMFVGTLLNEAKAQKSWAVQVALRALAAATVSLTKSGPAAFKTRENFLFAYAQLNSWLYDRVSVRRSFLTDDFCSVACGLAVNSAQLKNVLYTTGSLT